MRAVSRCRPRQQAAQGRDAERRVLRKASVVRRPSCPVGCPPGARPAPTRGYQRRPFCPSSANARSGASPKNNSPKMSGEALALTLTVNIDKDPTIAPSVCFIPPAPPEAGDATHRRREHASSDELAGRADLAMGVGGEGVPRPPDAHAGASRPLSRSCLQRSRGRSVSGTKRICSAICDPLENPGSIGGSVCDT